VLLLIYCGSAYGHRAIEGIDMQFTSALIVCLLLTIAEASAATRQVFTRTNGATCSDSSKEHMGLWTCAGPAGFSVTFFDEGNIVGVWFGKVISKKERKTPTSIWRGTSKVFGDFVEWRVDDQGIPRSAILRTWEAGENDEILQSLRVFAINAQIACEYANVSVTRPQANREAAAEAENAYKWFCTEK
jgi:hypothetical protein